ncbi:GNAT family N-acetyltransferase [Sedimentibacter saalensis]|uniref:Acetyltransferase (GNAT) family protein n=1 Tax=Sedimentibacter saalensis TaxID=130788 RepID=A0A562J5A5_9FIRM|nr:GNAT family N-acetyltransferase [Sedimentibacter saalensis]TWH78361.1 acetyltransferase (GNAT) family protein [Sedimentibacter saalensis]
MNIKSIDMNYIEAATKLAVDNYLSEQQEVSALFNNKYETEISQYINELFRCDLGVMVFENDNLLGYMAFRLSGYEDYNGYKKAYSPIYGYGIKEGIDRGKIASLLFQYASENLIKLNVRNFEVKVYSHDKEVISSFVLNQFGILCTDAIKNIDTPFCDTNTYILKYSELTKHDILLHRESLLKLWRSLAKHLQASPTYYYGEEFTDDAYWEYINDVNTRLFVAMDEGEIIGILDASCDGNCFANSDKYTINVGDLYLKSAYRGKNIAQELLQYVSNVLKKKNYKRLWVEHGTTNPNAQRFWDRYFSRFTYTLTRNIDERIVKQYIGNSHDCEKNVK